jgi:hypothetical protein
MVNLERDGMLAATVLISAYSLYSQPIGSALTAIGLAAIIFAVTKSLSGALVILIAALMFKNYSSIFGANPQPFTPTITMEQVEQFQNKNAGTVQARVESIKTGLPLAPKVEVITGILESPSVLNNAPLKGVEERQLGAYDTPEGAPTTGIPASAKARVLIYPPPESEVPAPKGSIFMALKDNPYLQTGQDRLAEEVSLAEKGTDLYADDSASLSGVAAGAGPAF